MRVRMSSGISSETLVRKLNHSILRKLSDFLDPQDAWKSVLVDIQKETGEPRYTQLHLRYGVTQNCTRYSTPQQFTQHQGLFIFGDMDASW